MTCPMLIAAAGFIGANLLAPVVGLAGLHTPGGENNCERYQPFPGSL